MVLSNKNLSFEPIRKLIYQIDINSGAFVLKDPSEKFTKKENFLSYSAFIHQVLMIFTLFSTLYIGKFEPQSSVVLCVTFFVAWSGFPIQMYKININKSVAKRLLDWCEGLYDIEKKFKTVFIYDIARTTLAKVQKLSEIIIEAFKRIIYAEIICVVLFGSVAAIFLPRITPKFSVPLPFYLPFEDQENWTTFIATVVFQIILSIYTVMICIFIYDLFFCIVFHIIGYLDMIQEIVETVFKEQIAAKVKHFDDVRPSVSLGTLKMDVLMEINDSTEVSNKKNGLEFTEWVKILCDMITDVNNQIISLKLLYTELFLSSEIQSLGSLFTCGLVFTVFKEQQFAAVGVTLFNVIFFFFCYINEMILQKFENIQRGFYDIPWYFLPVNEQRLLLTALNCSKIQDGFTAAGIHKLTLERFGIVFKAGYTNLIMLKDLIT